MKFKKSLLFIFLSSTSVLFSHPTFGQSNNSVVFKCSPNQGTYNTVVYNSKTDKEIPLIHWKQEYFDSQNVRENCVDAANKFQNRYNNNNNKLDSLAIDNSNHQKIVVCLINQRGDSCDLKSSDKLFQIKPPDKKQDFSKTLSALIDPNLANVDESELRTVARIYPKIQSKKWFGFF
ncbi:MAG: hypothetical protein DSM106950_12550 [Stigonema ocellatum SAG 48.90 = DSM 106950]|nr:hypothetical protein [Stigonema ocellatum SAG 48.90 = DSM 106950]